MPTIKRYAFYRVLLCGDTGVGKRSLIARFTENTFREGGPRRASDDKCRGLDVDGIHVVLRLCDLHGQERYHSTSTICFRPAQGVIFIYDVTNKQSFDNLHGWVQRYDSHGREDSQRLLIGNKSDMINERVVPYEEAQEFADRVGIPYMETSVKNDDNVERAFLTLASSLLKNLPQTPKTRTIADPSIVQLCRQRLRSSGCCATGTRYRNHRIVKS